MPDAPKPVEQKIDTEAIWIILYLFYKANMLTRHNVKHMMRIMEEKPPVNIIQYLKDEIAKSG